jgi:putative ABC transport system permease protein
MSVGVAMVVIVSGLGRGAQLKIENQIESAGPTMISIKSGNYRPAGIVTSGEPDTSGGEMVEGMVGGDDFSNPDIMASDSGIQSARARIMAPKKTQYRTPAGPLTATELALITPMPNVRAITATMAGNVTLDAGAEVSVRIARLQGFDVAWPDIRGWKLLEGRMVTEREHGQGAPLIMLSSLVAERLWPGQSALGKVLPVAGNNLTVVGVINDNVTETGTVIVPTVYVPLSMTEKLLKRSNYDEILVRTMSVASTTAVSKAIQEAMREQRALPEDTLDDFRVETQSISALPSLGIDPRQMRAVHSMQWNLSWHPGKRWRKACVRQAVLLPFCSLLPRLFPCW